MADDAGYPPRWLDGHDKHTLCYSPDASPASSRETVDTYASTIPSQEDLLGYGTADYYQIPEPQYDAAPGIQAATSKEFAELFPSTRRLQIRHDDTTEDGNMNLCITTTISPSDGKPRELQMFHLRMHDLRSRFFSFRRYCRDSGREICHSSRKVQQRNPEKKPSLQRSLSNAFSMLRPSSSHKDQSSSSHKLPPSSSQKEPSSSTNIPRHDSGYDSMDDDNILEDMVEEVSSNSLPPLDDAITIQFLTYANCILRRRGPARKHYDFEYWGHNYSWHRIVHEDGPSRHVSFRLTRRKYSETIAHIVTTPLSAEEAQVEKSKGGWIPQCTMWISDQPTIEASADVCDVIIATGLIALVDDSIRRKFHSKSVRELVVPMFQNPLGNGFISPQALVRETFGPPPPR